MGAGHDDYRRLQRENQLANKPARKNEPFPRLLGYLEVCLDDPGRLTGADVGMIQLILAAIARKRGLPGPEQGLDVRQTQGTETAHLAYFEAARSNH